MIHHETSTPDAYAQLMREDAADIEAYQLQVIREKLDTTIARQIEGLRADDVMFSEDEVVKNQTIGFFVRLNKCVDEANARRKEYYERN